VLFDNVFKQNGIQKIDFVVDVQDRSFRNTHLRKRFQTATPTVVNTPGTHNTVYRPKLWANDCWRTGFGGRGATWTSTICWLSFERRHRVNRFNGARTHQRWLRQQLKSVLFSDESRFSIHRAEMVRFHKGVISINKWFKL
jgi:hypothetical protein